MVFVTIIRQRPTGRWERGRKREGKIGRMRANVNLFPALCLHFIVLYILFIQHVCNIYIIFTCSWGHDVLGLSYFIDALLSQFGDWTVSYT